MIDILPGTIVVVFIVSFVFLIYDFITRYFTGNPAIAPDPASESSTASIEEQPTAKGATPIEELVATTDFPQEATVNNPSISQTPTVSSSMTPVVSPTEELEPLVGDSESPIPPEPIATPEAPTPQTISDTQQEPPTPSESTSSTSETPIEAKGATPIEELAAGTDFPEEATVSNPPTSETPTVSSWIAPVVSPSEELEPLVGDAVPPEEEDTPSDPSTPTEATFNETTSNTDNTQVEASTSGTTEDVEEEFPIAATAVPPISESSTPETVAEEEEPAAAAAEVPSETAPSTPSTPSTPETVAQEEEPAAAAAEVPSEIAPSTPSTPETVAQEEEPAAAAAAEVPSEIAPSTPSTPEAVAEEEEPAAAAAAEPEPIAPEAEASTASESSKEPTDDDDDNDSPPGPPSGGISSEGSTTGEVADQPSTATKPSPKTPKSRKPGGKRTKKNKSGGGQGFGFIAPQNSLDSISPPTQSGNDRPPKSFRVGWAMAILLLLGFGGTQISRLWESRPREIAAFETLNSQTRTTKTALLKELQVSPATFATYAGAWGIADGKSEFSADEAAKITSTATAMRSGVHPTWQAYLDATTEERTIASSAQTDGVEHKFVPQRYERLRTQVSQTVAGVTTEIRQNLDRDVVKPLFTDPTPAAMVSQGYGDCPPSVTATATNPPTEETPGKYLQAEARSE